MKIIKYLKSKTRRKIINFTKKFSRENLYELLQNEIEKINIKENTNLKILNIGSGGEIYNCIAKINNASITSIDISSKRNPDIIGDVCNMNFFEDKKFDYIFIMEVLEHVHNPIKAIKEIRRTLKKGGKLIMSTPFIFPIHDEPYDFFRFTKYGLKLILKNFRNITIKERNTSTKTILVLILRFYFNKNKTDKLFSSFFIIIIVMFYPFLFIADKIIKSHSITTGYFSTSIK